MKRTHLETSIVKADCCHTKYPGNKGNLTLGPIQLMPLLQITLATKGIVETPRRLSGHKWIRVCFHPLAPEGDTFPPTSISRLSHHHTTLGA